METAIAKVNVSPSEIFATIISLLALVGGFVGKYIIDALRERVKVLEVANNSAVLQSRLDATAKDIDALWDQIGRSSEEGMRKTVHYTANRCSEHGLSVVENGRRIDALERKVFNGHRGRGG